MTSETANRYEVRALNDQQIYGIYDTMTDALVSRALRTFVANRWTAQLNEASATGNTARVEEILEAAR